MKRILMYGAPVSNNLGGSSVLKCVCMCIRKHLPDAEIVFSPQGPERDKEQAQNYCVSLGIKTAPVFRWKYPYTAFGFFISLLHFILKNLGLGGLPNIKSSKNLLVKEIMAADLVMDIRGISQTDFFSRFITHINENLVLYVAHLIGKPTVKFTQDMGPFLKLSNRLTAKFFLPKISLIMVRGIIVKELLNEIGISKNVIVSHDTAFLLEPSNEPGLPEIESFFEKSKHEKCPVIGVTASRQVDMRSRKRGEGPGESEYMRQLLNLLKHILDNTNARLLFIPNEFAPPYDDLFIARRLLNALNANERCTIIEKSLDAPIMKRHISQCDIIISSRYHSIVAALSTCRPTLAIGWGFKYDQLLGLFSLNKFLVNHVSADRQNMIYIFNELWQQKNSISERLALIVPCIIDEIYKNSAKALITVNKSWNSDVKF